jgi:hypothetical protein
MSDQSTVAPHCGTVAAVEAHAVGRKRDGTAALCGSSGAEGSGPPLIANPIDCSGELALTDLAALDPHEVAILAALGC